MNFKNYLISQLKSILTHKNLLNSVLSAFIRNLMGKRLFFKYVFKANEKFDFNQIKNFLHLRIGFLLPQSSYANFIDLDYYNRYNSHYFVNLKNLPFKKNSVEEIYINHFFKYFPKKFHQKKAIKNWYKKLIPGGKVKLLFKKELINTNKFKKLVELLKSFNFKQDILNIDPHLEDKIGKYITLEFFKKNNKKDSNIKNELILQNKNKAIEYLKLNLNESEYKNKVIGILGRKKLNLKGIERLAKKIIYISSIDNLKEISESIDFCIIYDTLEYLSRDSISSFFQTIKKNLTYNSKFLIIVPFKHNFFLKQYKQLFNKGILTELLDKNNIDFEWMSLDVSLKFILVLIINKELYPLKPSPIKIAVLGNIETRYTQLNSFWDGQIRALIKLGYIPLILDSRTLPFSEILRRIKNYRPKYLLTGDYAARDFLKKNSSFFRQNNICISYWYRDVRTPEKYDFNGVINYMFLTNKGQIEDYKKNYKINNVIYMPQWCNPQFTRPNLSIREKYDVGFAGQIDFGPFHKKRTELLLKLKEKFNVKIQNAEFNSIAEFYSQCKIIFGNDMGFHQLFGKYYNLENNKPNKYVYLYASNRIFISIGCGACFFINYFPGIEKLFENEKHLVWYKNYDELLRLINKYLKNNEKRLYIKREAFQLAKEKHNYISRMQNVLDILMGKNNKFYGFL